MTDPSNRGGWSLAIDYGTTYTAAAIREGDRIELLSFNGAPRIASLVVVTDEGLLVGEEAENRALVEPEHVLQAPKRRIGERQVLVGNRPVAIVDAISDVMRAVLDEARRRQGGSDPTRVWLTHPARWGTERQNALRIAAKQAGLADPTLLPEPVAAALHYLATSTSEIAVGHTIAIYDLGGGTFDVAVLRRQGDAGFEVVATGGNDYLGGEDFDEKVYRYLGETVARDDPEAWERLRHSEERPWRRANAEFRRDARRLKEALSTTNASTIYLRSPVDRDVRLTRPELEQLVRPEIDQTLDELSATLQKAGIEPRQLGAIYLVGGSSRLRILSQLVRDRFGRADTRDDPKGVVAMGAAHADRIHAELRPTATATATATAGTAPAASAAPTEPRASAEATVPPAPATNDLARGEDTREIAADAGRRCPRCGAAFIPGTRFCEACGLDLNGGDPVRPTVAKRTTSLWPWVAAAGGIGALLLIVFAAIAIGGSPEESEPPSVGPTESAAAPPSTAAGIGVFSLLPGDCFTLPGGDEITNVDILDCVQPHVSEVTAVVNYPGAFEDPYPGGDELYDWGVAECTGSTFDAYVGIAYRESDFYANAIYPLEEAWQEGVREVICYAYLGEQEGERIDYSIRGIGR